MLRALDLERCAAKQDTILSMSKYVADVVRGGNNQWTTKQTCMGQPECQ